MQPGSFNNSVTNIKLTVFKDSQEAAADHILVEVNTEDGYDSPEVFTNIPLQGLPLLSSLMNRNLYVEGEFSCSTPYWLN